MKNKVMFAAALLAALLASGEEIRVADCVRDPKLDFWAAYDVEFCRRVMACVLTNSHATARHVEFNEDEAIADVGDEEVEVVEEVGEDEPPVMFTEEMPEYPGGPEALNAFLTREIQYPEVARNNGITGTVLIEFVVEKDGRVSNAKVKVPLFPECDKEAVRGVMAMPKWKPGKNMGKPVRCFYQVPVTFRQ